MIGIAIATFSVGAHQDRAENGEIAAGVAGGLLGGMLLGGALAPRPGYVPAPPPVYYDAEPIYVRHCYWTRGEPYWDDWDGTWRRLRVKVCD